MKTSSNTNNIESNNQEFFTKGKKYRCIKSVTSNKNGRETFTKGQIYEQYTEPSVFYGWLRNNQGERHAWPQIDEMADYLETWPETKPEDIDPRLYFEPVEIVTEAEALQPASVISDPDGREFRDFKTWNGMTVKAEERQKWTKFFADGISNKVNFGGNGSTYKHNAGKIRVSIAYRNGSKKAEDMSYCVSWYEETNKGTKLRESENGVSIWQAARAMADFHLLADKCHFQTVDEILNPCERPQAA